MLTIVLGALLLSVGCSFDTYPNQAYLDNNQTYSLSWKYNDTHIQFGIIVKNTGWVGLGISPNGQMPNSDVYISWVDDDTNKFYVQDRYALGHYTPELDSKQNVVALSGEQSNGYTKIEFVRPLYNCDDQDRDLSIEIGTTKLIYSYYPVDPDISDVDGTIHQHSVKGSTVLNLLNPVNNYINSSTNDAKYFDVVQNNITVPSQTTTYWCSLIQLPVLNATHHIIQFDPIITSGNEDVVHHILMYECPVSYVNVSNIGISMACDDFVDLNIKEADCKSSAVLGAWAIGGNSFALPSNVGMEFAGTASDRVQYVVLEIHYNNQAHRANAKDSSGLRLWYTPTLRENSASVIMTGIVVSDAQFIPPKLSYARNVGYCFSGCTSAGLPTNGAKVFANLLHAHTHGVALKLRHIRNGTELTAIDQNSAYDFNYQQFNLLNEEITLYPGDEFMLECYYNTTTATSIVFGGESTSEEMCLSFLMTYPKTTLRSCLSFLSPSNIQNWALTEVPEKTIYLVTNCTSSCDIEDYYYNVSVPGAIEAYDTLWNTSTQYCYCQNAALQTIGFGEYAPITITSAYTDPSICDDSDNDNDNNSYILSSNKLYLILIFIIYIIVYI